MNARTTKLLRWFVGLSLILGSLALLAGAIGLQASSPMNPWLDALIAVAVLAMAFLAALERSRAWPPSFPWYAPAALPILLLMIGVVWAHVSDPTGHLFLSGFAPFVAFLTGLGILERRPWSWPVAFASVTGFGPTILLFAPLTLETVYAALALFVLDALFLLALVQSYFEPQSR
ncbi:MAG TPA: hypothetical protein VEY12_09345 [Thermoplasmata archaeon]|nr:hypothetical protein [Thermoplasmata archaeon]